MGEGNVSDASETVCGGCLVVSALTLSHEMILEMTVASVATGAAPSTLRSSAVSSGLSM